MLTIFVLLYVLAFQETLPRVLAKFITQPGIVIPRFNETFRDKSIDVADGYIFLSPRVSGPRGLMILDKDLELVYFNNSDLAVDSTYFRPFTWGGSRVFVHHHGHFTKGYSNGSAYIVNQDYTLNNTITTKHMLDIHEFWINKDGYATATSYEYLPNVRINGAGNSNTSLGWITDSCAMDVNVKDENDVRFRFCPHKHLPFELAYNNAAAPPTSKSHSWDWFHMNAVSRDQLGNYMVSSRHTHTIYYVDGRTKKVLWQLGGGNSSFSGNGNRIAWQHYARYVGEKGMKAKDLAAKMKNGKRRISIFDNESAGWSKESTHSRGLIVELDFASMNATIVQLYQNPGGENDLLADSQGCLQLMSEEDDPWSDHVMMGYGAVPVWAEYTKDGKPIQVVWFGKRGEVQGYEVTKKAWVGYPLTKPAVAVKDNLLYVSWNGATEVDHWKLESTNDKNETETKLVIRRGFETRMPIDRNHSTFRVKGVTKDNCTLGISDYVDAEGQLHGDGVPGKNYAVVGMKDICPTKSEANPKQVEPHKEGSAGPEQETGQERSATRTSFETDVMLLSLVTIILTILI